MQLIKAITIMKNTKFLITLFLCFISTITLAQQTQPFAINISGKLTPIQKKLIADTFLYLNQFWADKGKSLSRNATAKYFTPDTTLIINGKTVYTGYDQFEAHFKEVPKSIIGHINFPLLEVMSAGNKVMVHFDENITDNYGNHYPTNVIAIFKLKNNKIRRWEKVVNSNYFCQPEAAKVVFSK